MSHIRRFDHVGITVADLDTVTAFFVGLGLEVEGRTFVEGEFVDTVIGIPGSRSHIVMLRPPEGGPGLELSSFVWPQHEPGSPTAMANELGLRNVPSGRHRSVREHLAMAYVRGQRESSCPWLSGSADSRAMPGCT
jgi:catechol 2,3-dioxygenase-like lactoylglutathione lyase family enzyme